MRNMSFMLTTAQVLAREKTVTRRVGWAFLKPGARVQAVEKGQGLKKGERVRPLALLEVTRVWREPLGVLEDPGDYGPREVAREGFPGLEPSEFVWMFMRTHKGVRRETLVTRVEFRYL